MTDAAHPEGPALAPTQADKPVYAALKLRIYDQLLSQFRAAGTWPTRDTLEPAVVQSFFRSLTARRVRSMLEEPPSGRARYTELYGAKPQMFYQRLLSLNHGLVLKATPLVMRRNKVFEWNEPIFTRNLCTMAAISHALKGQFHMGVDLIRLHETFGERSFTRSAFLQLFQRLVRSALRRHPAGERSANAVADSGGFSTFLDDKLRQLIALGLVERLPLGPAEQFRLTARGFEVGMYVDLFLHNIWFNGPVPQCHHCRQRSILTPGRPAAPGTTG